MSKQDMLFDIITNVVELCNLDYKEVKQVMCRVLNHVYEERD